MIITNRSGIYNDVMFKDMAESALYQKKLDNFHYTIQLLLNDKEIANLEDFRMVFNKPDEGQAKIRVTEILNKNGVAKIKKSDKLSIKISPNSPSKEPISVYEITEFFEELGELIPAMNSIKEVFIQPNKWIYISLKLKSPLA